MTLTNPQMQIEDMIFGPDGLHPAPPRLPYPTRPLATLYGEMVEYLIPETEKNRVLRQLYPYADPPAMDDWLIDIHENRTFAAREFKVVQQDGYVLLVSPYFAASGGSVIDWESLESKPEVHTSYEAIVHRGPWRRRH